MVPIRFPVAVSVALVTVALGACGGDDGSGAAAPVVPTTPATAAPGRCEPGRVEVDGATGRRWCGPATAELTIGTSRVELAGGACAAGEGTWSANLGTAFPDAAEPPAGQPYVGLTIGAAGSGLEVADGTYPDALLVWTAADGSSGQGTGEVTLSQGLTTAVFEGTSLFTGEEILGSVRCERRAPTTAA